MTREWRQVRAILSAVSLFVLFPADCSAQSQDERAVRAAYVFNLIKFVDWPAETPKIVIGFLGNREAGEFLHKMLDGKNSDSKPIHIMLFPTEQELQQCSILYTTEAGGPKLRATLDKLDGKNILTIGEADSFAQDGGMIALVNVGERIQMQVNPEAIRRTGMKVSPRLFSVALAVHPGASQSSDRKERKIVERWEPQYPKIASSMALHGTVKLKVRVAPDGTVRDVECTGGHPLLAQSALEAVKRWKFEPAARETTQQVDVDF